MPRIILKVDGPADAKGATQKRLTIRKIKTLLTSCPYTANSVVIIFSFLIEFCVTTFFSYTSQLVPR